MSTPAAAEWEKHVDDETQAAYYYNTRTGESSWEEPEGFVDASANDEAAVSATSEATGSATDEPAKPPRWRRYIDDSNGKPYFYDEANDVTQWEEPDGEVEDASDDEDDRDENASGDESAANDNAGEQDQEREGEAPVDAESGKKPTSEENSSEPTSQDAPTATHNWVKHVDKATGKPYYHDTISNTTQWEAPEHFTEASQPTAVSAEYLEYLHRSRAEKLARATQRALDPEGNLSKLNALLSKIGDGGAGASADEVDAPEDVEQDLKNRARAEWQQHVDPQTQRYYYHNIVTGETQWQKPEAPVVSALADWIPPVTEPVTSTGPTRTVSGQLYAATAKFNRVSGRFEKLGGDAYFETKGVAADREGRQMSHFFDVQHLEKNREDAKRIKEQLKRKNIDWKKVAAEKKAKKQKRQNEWIYQD